jgi:NADH-quinone oxidoreductase subunit I
MIDEADILHIDAPELGPAERLYLPQIVEGMKTTIRHLGKTLTTGPLTVQYPEEQRELRVETYRGVHRLNRDEQGRVACVACFMCATACPANCIHIEGAESPWPDREKYPTKFDIDELRCIYCGMCEHACPVDAIELTPGHDLVGKTREEMILDKEELLAIFDQTVGIKPRKTPYSTGYPGTGGGSCEPACATALEQCHASDQHADEEKPA